MASSTKSVLLLGPVLLLGLCLASACGGDDPKPGGEGDATRGDVNIRRQLDAELNGSDQGVEGDAESADAPIVIDPDQGLVREVDDCVSACQVFADCGRLDAWAGQLESCRAACEASGDNPLLGDFYTCVAVTSCEELQTCVPPPPPPANCSDVCEAGAACPPGDGSNGTIDEAIPREGGCAAACADPSWAGDVTRCGEGVLAATCDFGELTGCLLESEFGDCYEACNRLAECDLPEADDLIECTRACGGFADAEEDALRRYRHQRRTACLATSNGDCGRVAVCLSARGPVVVGEGTIEELCEANVACPFFALETCAEDAAVALAGLEDSAIDCLITDLTDACLDGEIYACFVPAPRAANPCDEHCLIGDLCGLLPNGQTEGACSVACQAALDGEDAGARLALEAGFACDGGASCAEVEACRDFGELGPRCDAVCVEQVACGLSDDAVRCAADCVQGIGAQRGQAGLRCVEAAVSCAGVERCLPPVAPDCAALCALTSACGEDQDECLILCDDSDFADPDWFLPQLACAASTSRCSVVLACAGGELTPGEACLADCRRQLDCAGAPADEAGASQCLLECGLGQGGQEGRDMELASACLVLAADDCAALDACLAVDRQATGCETVCGELDRCVLGDGGCVDACNASWDEPAIIDSQACTLHAMRRLEGCAPVASCNGLEVAPASAPCASTCGAVIACDDQQDSFLCERACDVDASGDDVRAACADAAACDELGLCLASDGSIPMACDEACAALELCPGGLGDGAAFADTAACSLDCGGRAILEGEYPADFGACVTQLSAGGACGAQAVNDCIALGNVDPICVASWDAVVGCGFEMFVGGGQAMYFTDCMANLVLDEAATRMTAQCMIDVGAMAGGDQAACFGLIMCFAGGLPM